MKLAFCGLGLMGGPMARRLLEAGHSVRVWNRSPDKAKSLQTYGAVACATPAEAAEGVDAVILCLLNAAVVREVVFGAQGVASKKGWGALIDHSSIAPELTQAYAKELQEIHGAPWIDAPVSGGVAGASNGSLAIMAGGQAHTLESIKPALAAYAARVTHLGPVGAGQTAKLCNQIIVAATVAAVAEAMSLAQAAGIEAQRLPEAFSGGWADSKPMQVFAPRMLQPPPDVLGSIETMLKDIDGALQQAKSVDVATPVAATVQQALRQVTSMGYGSEDLSSVVLVSNPVQALSGVRRAGGRA
ncbi:MAG: NAD(P)-dependent oxidoreductase [Comamonas sp.]